MRSIVQVYNTAIGRLGGNQFDRLNSPNDESTVGTLCSTFFPHVLDMCLAYADWGFARKYADLALLDDTEPFDPDMPYRFALPADCLRPAVVTPPGAGWAWGMDTDATPQGRAPFEIIGQAVATGINPARLYYVARIEAPEKWPPMFADAVAWGLASELSTAMVNDPNRQQFYMEQSQMSLSQAAAIERNSQHRGRREFSWVQAR